VTRGAATPAAATPAARPRSWVVALEVDEDPDGPDLDVKAVARRMEAVAGIHPSSAGGRRHSFLVRLDGQDAADALVAAVSRFREAPVRGGALLGARVVRSDDEDATSGRRVVPRPRILAAAACALLGAAAMFALVQSGDGHRSVTATRAVSIGNLLSNGSFEVASERVDKRGLARGVTGWGDAHMTLVSTPVHTGKRAQRLQVGVGRAGGLWFEVPVEAGKIYEQSGWIQVSDIAGGSRVEMMVEWYGSDANMIDYHVLALTSSDTALVRRSQTVQAPPHSARARYLVNITGGGSLVVDGAGLQVSPPSPPAEMPAPAPAPAPAPTAPDPARR
jgi:hypothetical protein